jgi:RNA polymerase sigma-70 factor (ECF subfamily)
MANAPHQPNQFLTTRWTLVVAARDRAAPEAAAALTDLFRMYWYPLYAYIRRRGHDAGDAEDLTQAFFTRLLEKDVLATVTPARGRFRSFLLTACQNFLANEHERAGAIKRGGGRVVSLDLASADGRYRLEPDHDETPERLFERRWALALLAGALDRLKGEYECGGKAALFDGLKGQLTGEQEMAYAAIAGQLGMTEGAVKLAAHRLRKRYAELLRAEIAETVDSPADVEEEVQALFAALGK